MNEFLRRMLFLPEQASSFAQDVDRLHYFVILTTIVMSTAVGLTALAFFVRFRRRSENQTTPHVTPNTLVEATFIGVPLALFLLWFAIGYREYVKQTTPPPDSMDVYVMAKKWMWKFAYPDGPNAVNVLRIPANRPVRLLMTSQDVIHSFYVPSFRVKQDVIPGRYTQTWFEAIEPGRYEILCTEYCGAGHSIMRAEVIVMKPQEYEDWLQGMKRGLVRKQDGNNTPLEFVPPASSLAEQGRQLSISVGCAKCHSVDGTRHIGPTWLDMYGRREKMQDGQTVVIDEGYMTESIMDPLAKIVAGYQPVMPSYQNKLAGPEIAALVEYMKSLQSDAVRNGPPEGPVYAPIRGR
ncbi:MAG: cytochrome c oxidase subunit II [Myxococcales bacterium]